MIKVPGLVISRLAGLAVRNRNYCAFARLTGLAVSLAFTLFDLTKRSTQLSPPLQGLRIIHPNSFLPQFCTQMIKDRKL